MHLSAPHLSDILRIEFMKPSHVSSGNLSLKSGLPGSAIGAILANQADVTKSASIALGKVFNVSPLYFYHLQTDVNARLWDQQLAQFEHGKRLAMHYKHANYRKLMCNLWHDINQQYLQIAKKYQAVNRSQMNRYFGVTKYLKWYNGDLGLEHLMFQCLCLSQPHQTKLTKSLAHQYFGQMNHHNFDSDAMTKYLQKYHTSYGFEYVLLNQPAIVTMLWEDSQIRNLCATWLKYYLRLKRLFGYEVETSRIQSITKLNRYQQLLLGVRTDSNHIIIPSYHRKPKQVLTYQQWQQKLTWYGNEIPNMWD